MTLEQNVNLTVGPVLHLWNPEPSHGSAKKGGTSPNVAALAAQVPLIIVEHVASKEDARNIDHVVGTSSDTGCQWPETNGRCLADDDP
jgi:thiamine biosynthesis lipoprotein ApbE